MNKNDTFLRQKKKAFTLVEVVIVLAITVIVLAIMYEFLTESKKAMVSNEVNSTLQDEAEDIQMELIKFGTPCNKILKIDNSDVNDTWTYATKLDATSKVYNGATESIKLEYCEDYGSVETFEIKYNSINRTLTVIEPSGSSKVLSTHVTDFKIKPLDAASNPSGDFSKSIGLQFVVQLKMKKGYSDVTCPVNVNVKFRNKGVATETL